MNLQRDYGKEHLYLQVYEYYKEQILRQELLPGKKMPSLRRCCQELGISRTTAEAAYLQLAADGYLLARPQSGYYVTEIAVNQQPEPSATEKSPEILYNFSTTGVDRESFHFQLWRRYVKSALRQDERLLSYGQPQGEWDFRQALCDYIREHRNVVCTPENIVVGAGVQSLLHILCPLLKDRTTVSFPTPSFLQGITVFSDHGFQVHYRDKNCSVIYVSPAHMTKWGEIMPVSRRMELVRHAADHGSLIIEDDFENEFVYLQRPTPALHSLSGGRNVIYIGSFSKLLLPSIRISFMVLPGDLTRQYQNIARCYNQTASKAEQIALCQFIRDGHLASQTRRLKKLYGEKLQKLIKAVQQVFGEDAPIRTGASGTSLTLTVQYSHGKERFLQDLTQNGIQADLLKADDTQAELILSCSSLPEESFLPGLRTLKKLL